MSLAVTVYFLESSFKLDKKLKKYTMDAISQLENNPENPALSCHRINRIKCDPTLNLRERIYDTVERIARRNHLINRVLLVGGSSQIPYIKEIIQDVFRYLHLPEQVIEISYDSMHAVALGAAIQQALRQGESVMPFRENFCKNIVARDILLGCGLEEPKLLVKRGKTYPFQRDAIGEITIPHSLSENVFFALYEASEERRNSSPILISTYEYYLPLYYTGDKILVNLNIGDDGLYQVSAMYEPMQDTVSFETHKEHMLSDKEFMQVKQTVAGIRIL